MFDVLETSCTIYETKREVWSGI